nr:MAG: ORF1 [Torque teno virus]
MAWRWWKRKRRWWWRKRWTRGRFRRRRTGRPRRRPRRRRVRRKRQWRRGRRRRTYNRRRRRLKKKRRPKLTLRLWQPDMVRNLKVSGYIPIIISGFGTFSRNFSSHLLDKVIKEPFGGGHSTMRFSLQILFEEHLRGLNYWSYSNTDLELVRYKYCKFTFFRHPDTDYIVQYNRKTPLGGNILTAPSLHPGSLMLQKYRVLVPSWKTKPKGKGTVTIKIPPPTMLTDKWYFSKDVADLTLLNLNAVSADLRFPFCSPQTNTTCITFQVLSSVYNKFLSITEINSTNEEDKINDFLNAAMPKDKSANILNTFKSEGNYSHPSIKVFNGSNRPSNDQYFATNDSLWGDAIFVNSAQSLTQLKKKIKDNIKNYKKKVQQEITATTQQGTSAFYHLVGIYGSSWLNQGRMSPEILGLYTEVIYNPYTDKGVGNLLWIDPLNKSDNLYKPPQSKCPLKDMPLWQMCFGYIDWVKKELNHWDAPINYRILLRSPYTFPKLYHDTQPEYGFVIVSYNFTAGKMPDGSMYVPILYRTKWYPYMLNQEAVMEDISRSGPFAPKQEMPSTELVAKYTFKWKLGGNPISEQVVKDPSTQPTYELPAAGTIPRRVQVIDPKIVGPNISFKSWEIRRGYFSSTSIKRMSEQQETSESYFPGPKRPRIDLPKYEPPEESWSTLQRELRPWTDSEAEKDQSSSEEEEERPLREQLQLQLKEQQHLRRGIQCLFEQLLKTQQGVHVNPCLA